MPGIDEGGGVSRRQLFEKLPDQGVHLRHGRIVSIEDSVEVADILEMPPMLAGIGDRHFDVWQMRVFVVSDDQRDTLSRRRARDERGEKRGGPQPDTEHDDSPLD